MQSKKLCPEITSLELQLKSMTAIFDSALKKTTEFENAKKLFHEIRILKDRLVQLNNKTQPRRN